MNNKSNKNKFLTLAALALITTGLAATVGQSNDGRLNPDLKMRAHKIFAYDKLNAGELPPNRLYALSIAIKFQDNPGASVLVRQLETQISQTGHYWLSVQNPT